MNILKALDTLAWTHTRIISRRSNAAWRICRNSMSRCLRWTFFCALLVTLSPAVASLSMDRTNGSSPASVASVNQWENLHTQSSSQEGRVGHSMTRGHTESSAIIFGGIKSTVNKWDNTSAAFLGDTWLVFWQAAQLIWDRPRFKAGDRQPTPRDHAAMATVMHADSSGGGIAFRPATPVALLYGGAGPGGAVLGDLWAFTFTNQTWTELIQQTGPGGRPKGPGARCGHTAVAWDSSLYIYGGADATYNSPSEDSLMGSVWQFEFRGLGEVASWTYIQPSHRVSHLPAARFRHSAAITVVSGSSAPWMYVFAGLPANGSEEADTALDDFWRVDLETGTWTQLTGTDIPAGRYDHAAVMVGNGSSSTMYLLYGYLTAQRYPKNHMWRYDIGSPTTSNGSWSLASNTTLQSVQPLSRTGFTAISMASHRKAEPAILLYGGEAHLSRYLGLSFDDTWLFSVRNAAWERQMTEAYPPLRISHSAVVTDDARMIVYGGLNVIHGFLNDIWSLTLDFSAGPLHEWMQLPTIPPTGLVGRSSHSAILFGGEMIIYGGTDSLSTLSVRNDCWVSERYQPLGLA